MNKLVFVNRHGCPRMVKQSVCLHSKGYEVSLLCGAIHEGRGAFTRKLHYEDGLTLSENLKLFDDSYIFHVHNEPSWMVSIIREVHPKARIVFDVHDSNYFRTEGDFCWYEEEIASSLCDAFVFVCNRAAEKFERDRSKPFVIVPSANPKSLHSYGPWDYWGGICCEGGHVSPLEMDPGNHWRDYTQIYALLNGKKQVFAYGAGFTGDPKNPLDDYYIKLGCKLGKFGHGELLQSMGRHDWGLCGNINNHIVWQITMPNKFFDYIAAGLPVINFQCNEAKDLIDEWDVGIHCESVNELLERWDEHKEKRANVFRHRHKFATMENYIGRLEGLYKELS